LIFTANLGEVDILDVALDLTQQIAILTASDFGETQIYAFKFDASQPNEVLSDFSHLNQF
jgi:hypothetical protein